MVKLYSDIAEDEPGSIRWYSRMGSQIDQVETVMDIVVPDLFKENIRKATFLLALNLETFNLLIQTLEMLQVCNLEEGTKYQLVVAQMVLPIGDRNRHTTPQWRYTTTGSSRRGQ